LTHIYFLLYIIGRACCVFNRARIPQHTKYTTKNQYKSRALFNFTKKYCITRVYYIIG